SGRVRCHHRYPTVFRKHLFSVLCRILEKKPKVPWPDHTIGWTVDDHRLASRIGILYLIPTPNVWNTFSIKKRPVLMDSGPFFGIAVRRRYLSSVFICTAGGRRIQRKPPLDHLRLTSGRYPYCLSVQNIWFGSKQRQQSLV